MAVRVDPPVIKFTDVQAGQVYKTKVTATNVGKNLTKIIFEMPASKMFKFTQSSADVLVVPGLYVSGLLEFSPETEEHVRSGLMIYTDKDSIEVPIIAFPKSCCLLMNPVVDFGRLAATNQMVRKHHSIINQGSAPGVFQVQHSGDSSIKITPSNGVVAAGATQWIKVELRTDTLRDINEKVCVKLHDWTGVLNIRAKIVDSYLEAFDLQGAPLSCLWFGPVYFGTSHVEKIVLKNNAPQTCDWVCVLQDSASGTELGTDLQRTTTTDAALLEKVQKCSLSSQDVSQIFMCFPKQGRLGPYDETTLTLCFSPVCKRSHKEKRHCYTTRRQDYCVFLLFESVGSKHGFTHHNGHSGVELAVTGSGLPVSLVPSPSQHFNFLSCVMGQSVDLPCVLQNLCPQLPVNFRFRKLPHFSSNPSTGTIAPGESKDIVLSFTPRQQGAFHMLQKIDVLGHVRERRARNHTEEFEGLQLHTFHTITMHLSAVCRSETTHPLPKLNPGITPLVTNPIGLHPYVRSSDLSQCRDMVPAAVLSADRTHIHRHRRQKTQNSGEQEFVAFPNDRAQSMRPPTPLKQCRTIFTDVPRHRYVDTYYAFTPQEKERRRQHRQIYADLFNQRRQMRLQKLQQRQQDKIENDLDLGIAPSQGLVPPKLLCKDFERKKTSFSNSGSLKKSNERISDIPSSQQPAKKVSGVLNAVPSTSQEVAECGRTLSTQELYKVVLGPLSVNFGEVCVQSVCTQKLDMINHLSDHVWVQLEVDCPELQGSSPVSHVLPPHSHTALTLTFQSTKLGEFYRPVPYTVNKKHPGQILVQAHVVPVALELSTDLLVLQPTPTWLARSGYRSSVTLRNPRNHPAEFTWKPVVTDTGILFSVRPATGVVEAYTELDCEVVWHAAFSSPVEGDFDLCVNEGKKQRLHCVAKVGCTSVRLAEKKRMAFESVPLNMTSVKMAVLCNTGPNHAFYQVLDVCPLPGMVVSPAEGIVPRGGQALLNIYFNPDSVIRFDTRVEIALKGMESIELRVGGSVEPPNVEISVSHFQLFEVYLGSRRSVPFSLTNHSSAPAQVTFDLSDYTDFSVQLLESSMEEPESGVGVVEIQGNQKMNCALVFCPSQVASYDFELPVTVNGMVFSSTFHFPIPPSSSTSSTLCSWTSGSSRATVRPVPQTVSMVTGSPHVEATVLCAPLEISPSSLHFNLAHFADTYSKAVMLKAEPVGKVCWSILKQPIISWWIDSSVAEICAMDEEETVWSVSPSSGSLGPDQSIFVTVSLRPEGIQRVSGAVTKLTFPVYLGEKPDGVRKYEELQPYRELSITVHHLPSISVHPPQLLLTPVPLRYNMTATLTLVATGYTSGTHITAVVSDVEQENERKQQPLSLTFPQGSQIPAQDQNKKQAVDKSIICNVSFCSDTPMTLSAIITFTDHLQNRFKVKVWAVADKCMLTIWPYIASHRSEQQVVLKTVATAVEAVLQNFPAPSARSCRALSSSSTFGHSSSINKTSGTDSFPGSNCVSGQSSSEAGLSSNRRSPTNCGVPEFSSSNSEEGLFYQSVCVAVERWFSLFGWANGPHPISVPHTVRRVPSKIQTNHPRGKTQSKSSRSVVDMLIHLTGKQIPGIPHSQSMSDDINQQTTQLIQQYKAILAFLRVQGACLCYIRPEYLLDKKEFNHWSSRQVKDSENSVDYSSIDYESMSKRSWTELLLQIYKVFVLCRVSQQKNTDVVPVCCKPRASNIYSSCELQLLSWLNVHYESMRKTVWTAGDIPSARWIVNFDLDFADGLVLAALIAAYCPYLICSHFKRMYTKPSSLEQILHNNIIVERALTTLSLNIDIYPTDLSDPNPVQMLMLCVHLNKKLPQYKPTQTITLSGELHSTISKQVHLTSPTLKPIKYKALLLGEDAHLFSLPGGLSFTIPAKGSTGLTIQYDCAFLQPKEAALLLFSSSTFGAHGTLAFHLKTCVTHISPTKSVKCSSPCYKLKLIQLPITSPFKTDGNFKVLLVDSVSNPLEPEKQSDSPPQHAASKPNPLVQKMTKGKFSDLNGDKDTEFSCAMRSIFLKSGQAETLTLAYLPFSPGIRYCCVLLLCPQAGDLVFMVKATAELPLSVPLTAKPSHNIKLNNPVLSLQCKVGEVCNEVIRLPIINMAWEQALAIWGQHRMSAEEHRRRSLTHTLHSSTVRGVTAVQKLGKQQAFLKESDINNEIKYSIEVSLPQFFSLPSTVTIPVNENIKMPWENPADCGCVEIPLRFQADAVGTFTCEMVLRSWCDTRVYVLEAMVTTEERSAHLDFSTPAHRSVTQYIPLHNETDEDLKMLAELYGEGFSGPDVFTVSAGTKASYPLTFHPATQHIVKGKLILHNECNGTEHMFTLRGVGECPLPVVHLILHGPVGKSTEAQLNVPNYNKTTLTLKVKTDLSIVSGPAYLKIKPGQTAPYRLIISPWKRGTQKGCLSFVEMDKRENEGLYEVFFTFEIICEPAEPLKIINVHCTVQSNVAIEIPINNPHEDQLDLDVFMKGHGLSGDKSFSLPPHKTFTYKAIFSPCVVGKHKGSVVFQSEMVGEFWYQLELYALPLPVVTLPEIHCQLGRWKKLTLPLVNPTPESVELTVSNSNPRNYTLEMVSANTLTLEPHSSSQLGVRFSPSSIGKTNHKTKITFTCPQLQQWCFSLSGCGLNPECEEPVSISSKIGSNASINIPFTNPTELQAVLHITLTDKYPNESFTYHSGAFSIPLSQTEGVQIAAGASIDVPVVYTPTSIEIEKAWLYITLNLPSNPDNTSTCRASTERLAQDLSTICWIYPLCGIPSEVPVESPPLGLIQCEAGCQLEKKVDVLLSGCGLGNQEVTKEDFLCEVHSDHEAEDSLSAVVESAIRDPDSGIIKLGLHLVYSPLEPCKSQFQAAVMVKCVSGGTWEFPVTLFSTKPVFDDVIHIEATEFGKTSAVGFRLTSTTRSPEPFTVAFVPGSSSEFTVTPASGMLPPIGSSGALITVSFTPSPDSKRSRARLKIKAADMHWTYEVKGNTVQKPPSPCSASSKLSSSIIHLTSVRQKNFVAHNLHIPGLANSSPLKLRR